MINQIWTFLLYKPLLNILAVFVSIVPGGDLGVAVIVLTILVKLALFPIAQRSLKNQAAMKLLEPEMNKIKTSGATKEEQAKQTMEIYKKYKVNPFSGCLLVLIQLPIIFALYYVFLKGINFDSSSLYSFVSAPQNVSMKFLGFWDISGKSLVLAIIAGISQFCLAYFMPKAPKSADSTKKNQNFQETFAKSMNMQMKYVFPFIVALIAYNVSGAVALYWVTSNIFTIGQQVYVNKKNKSLELLSK